MTAVDGTNYTREFFLKSLNYSTVLETFSPFGHLMHCYRSSRQTVFARRFTILKTVYSQYTKLVSISLNCHFCCQIAYLITGVFFCNAIFVFPNIFMRNFRPKFSSVYFGMIFSTLGLFHCSLSSHFMI